MAWRAGTAVRTGEGGPRVLPSREEAWNLLLEFTQSESLIKHALAVEAAMRHYARHFGEDEDRWGITGLLHDFDYERWPNHERNPAEGHPVTGAAILAERGYPEDVIYAIKAHADYLGLPRHDLMSRTLYAVDELSGFIVAVSLVQPGKSIHRVTYPSVAKRLKSKGFARGVNRDDVYRGAEELGVPFGEHVERVIAALQACAPALGLDGQGEG